MSLVSRRFFFSGFFKKVFLITPSVSEYIWIFLFSSIYLVVFVQFLVIEFFFSF